jgi:opacity protein-like surface antigen
MLFVADSSKQRGIMMMGSVKWMKVVGIAVCLVGMMTVPGHAIWVGGQSQINPFLEVSGVYESNIFRVSDDSADGEDSDFITVISPGIYLKTPIAEDSMYRLTANYRANIKLYGNNGDSEIDPDEELNTVEHLVGGELRFNFASGFKTAAGYSLLATSDAPDSRGDTRDEYLSHKPFVEGGYRFADRYEIVVRYDGNIKSYSDSDNEASDVSRNSVQSTVFYRIRQRLSLLGGGGYANISRENPYPNSDEYTAFAGVKYDATERTTGLFKAGIVSKSFDEDAYDDESDFYMSGELEFAQSEETNIYARLFREFTDSTTAGGYYVTTGLNTRITHTLAALPNLTLVGSFDYSQDGYPDDVDRSDGKIDLGMGLQYAFTDYIITGANYLYSSTDSDVDGYDFVNHTATMMVRFVM